MGQGTEGKVLIEKCCFCLELKTGVLVLGILSSILLGIGLIGYIVNLAVIGIAAGLASHDDSGADFTIIYVMLIVWLIGTLIIGAHFICAILLACGASKGKPGLL